MTRNSAGFLFKVTFADGVTYVKYANFVMSAVGSNPPALVNKQRVLSCPP